MALSNELAEAGFTLESVETHVDVTLGMVDGNPAITKIKLTVKANISDIENDKFQEFAERTKKNCPVSKALASIDISLDASLAN